jgi:gluconokinase
VFGRAQRWVSFAEYVFIRLFGDAQVSVSMASATGLFNQNTCEWDSEMLSALPISTRQLSDIAVDGAPAGELASRWNKRWPALKGAAWYPAWGDGACSNVGCNCTAGTRMALSIGTSGALRVMLKKTEVPTPEGLWRYRLDRDRVIIGGALSNGGNLARWLDATLRTPKRTELLSTIARLPADGHGLTVLPFLDGERSPDYRSDARAAIAGMSLSTTPEQIVRAFLEAVSYRFGIIHDRLSGVMSNAADIIANGGAILNRPVWMKITADVLGQPLVPSDVSEATSRGAALVALQSLGAIDSIDTAPVRFGEPVQPDAADHHAYKLGAARQALLYQRLVEQPLTASPSRPTANESEQAS